MDDHLNTLKFLMQINLVRMMRVIKVDCKGLQGRVQNWLPTSVSDSPWYKRKYNVKYFAISNTRQNTRQNTILKQKWLSWSNTVRSTKYLLVANPALSLIYCLSHIWYLRFLWSCVPNYTIQNSSLQKNITTK